MTVFVLMQRAEDYDGKSRVLGVWRDSAKAETRHLELVEGYMQELLLTGEPGRRVKECAYAEFWIAEAPLEET